MTEEEGEYFSTSLELLILDYLDLAYWYWNPDDHLEGTNNLGKAKISWSKHLFLCFYAHLCIAFMMLWWDQFVGMGNLRACNYFSGNAVTLVPRGETMDMDIAVAIDIDIDVWLCLFYWLEAKEKF